MGDRDMGRRRARARARRSRLRVLSGPMLPGTSRGCPRDVRGGPDCGPALFEEGDRRHRGSWALGIRRQRQDLARARNGGGLRGDHQHHARDRLRSDALRRFLGDGPAGFRRALQDERRWRDLSTARHDDIHPAGQRRLRRSRSKDAGHRNSWDEAASVPLRRRRRHVDQRWAQPADNCEQRRDTAL